MRRTFIEKMLSADSDVSSKRIMGAFCIAVYVGIVIATIIGLEVSDVQVTLLNNLLYVGAGLLGVGVLEKRGESYNQERESL
jgi:hypothetical protein